MQATGTKSFGELMEELRAGSQEAAWELVERYGPHVQRFVRRIMQRELQSKFDSVDFVQIMWASIFREPERFAAFSEPDQLVAFLKAVARNKVLTELRRRTQCDKYDVNKELRLSAEGVPHDDKQLHTPSAFAIAKERWRSLVSAQNATVKSVASMRLRGESFAEIAEKLQINERTARKAIAKLTGDYEELVSNDENPSDESADEALNDSVT